MNKLTEYKTLYQYDDKHKLVIDEISGDIYIQKTLTHYDVSVYSYLKSHPDRHIPRIISFQESDGTLVVIEEYISGNTFDVIINDPSKTDNEKIRYFVDLGEGLKFLHNAPQPIIHRDLKPSNILVKDDNSIVIIDYDAAKTFKANQDQDTTCIGTEGRAAPEQYGFKQSDARTDIYAVGRMIKDAFPGNDRIQKIAAKAMTFDPDGRYDDVDSLMDSLTRKIGAKPLKPLWPIPGFRTRTWWKIPLALIGYTVLIFVSLGVTKESATEYELFLTKLFFLFTGLTIIDICTSWSGIYDILPFVNDKRFYVRYPLRVIYSASAFVVMIILLIMLAAIIRVILSWF